MMVDDDEIRGERLAPRSHHETVAKSRTRLSQAVFAGRGRKIPRRSLLRHIGKLALVSAAADACKAHDALQVGGDLATGRPGLRQVAFAVILAHVVGPAF